MKKPLVMTKLEGKQSDLNSYGLILARLLNQIRDDIKREVLSLYQQRNLKRANDSLFGDILLQINLLIKKYSEPKEAIKSTELFSKSNSDYVFFEKRKFSKKNDLILDWKPTQKTRDVLEKSISENVDLIKTIPAKYLEDVKKDFYEASIKGWDMQRITQALNKRHGVSKRRAFNIAVDQRNKVINAINKQTNEDAGLFSVKWNHRAGVRKPRESHEKAHGKIYDLRKGCLIDGKYIQPGEEINCHCFSTVIIPTKYQRKSS